MKHISSKNFPVSARVARRNGGSPWFNGRGELNASSRSDAISQLASLMQAVASGDATLNDDEEEDQPMTASERHEMLLSAYYDRSTAAWSETGSTIGAVLYETAIREGFLRRFLKQGDLQNGNIPRINVRFPNVQALVATSPTIVAPQIPKIKYIYPPEFYVLGNVRVAEMDIAQGAPDILEDAYAHAIEQVNVNEDRVVVGLFDKAVGAANPLFLLAGGATPSNISAMRTAILQWGLPADHFLIAADYWTDIAGNAAQFGAMYDPVTKYELVQTGFLGTLLGMGITTDGFRDPQQQVVAPNTCYLLTSDVNLGAFTDRGPVKATPIDNYPDGIPGRGWYFNELLSIVVANPRGVVKGLRV